MIKPVAACSRRVRAVPMVRRTIRAALVVGGLLAAVQASAQDLDPRAYVHAPINSTVAITGFSYSSGSVLTDPTLPVTNVEATVSTPSAGVARVFSFFGKTAQAMAALPYSWAEVTGEINEQAARTTRSGLADMRLRLSVLVAGAPAMSLRELAKAPRKPIVGVSLTASPPTGQYYPQKFINLGTHRWAFKPEVALSYPFGRKWLADVYAAAWLFTANETFYPGSARRTQDRVRALQAHISYSFTPKTWVAFNSTWYGGGQAAVDGTPKGSSLSSARVGATLGFPVGRRHAVKIAYSTGAIVRFGANFTTLSVAWQTAWFDKPAARR
jgi:hypothetical protein